MKSLTTFFLALLGNIWAQDTHPFNRGTFEQVGIDYSVSLEESKESNNEVTLNITLKNNSDTTYFIRDSSSLRLVFISWSLYIVGPVHGGVDPFLRPYALTLDDLGSNGDLALNVPLAKWRIEEGQDIDVLLSHRQESLEYGAVSSRFDLLPFQTSITLVADGAWLWLQPGGAKIRFEPREGKLPDLNSPRMGQDRTKLRQVLTAANAQLTIFNEDQLISADAWEFSYKRGVLSSIKTPHGHTLQVAATGKYITSISEGNIRRVAIDRNGTLAPTRLWLDGNIITFEYNPSGSLAKATSGSRLFVNLTYRQNGLLASVARPGFSERAFTWEYVPDYVRGDSGYPMPYALKSGGKTMYNFRVANNVVYLRSDTGDRQKRLTIGKQYGRIKWISEGNGPWGPLH